MQKPATFVLLGMVLLAVANASEDLDLNEFEWRGLSEDNDGPNSLSAFAK